MSTDRSDLVLRWMVERANEHREWREDARVFDERQRELPMPEVETSRDPLPH